MTVNGGDPDAESAALSLLVGGEMGRVMREVTRSLGDAHVALARETDPARQETVQRLIGDVTVRSALLAAQYARVCLGLVGQVGVEEDVIYKLRLAGPEELAALGFRFASALSRFDPRIHGDEVALHELRGALIGELPAPVVPSRKASPA